MAFSNVPYIGDGVQTIYDIPFPYLSQDHISVQIDGVLTTAYTFISASQIQFDVAPADQSVIFIQRSTSPDERLVAYTNNAFLGADPLNEDSLQAFYLAQEGLDAITTALPLDPADLTWDGQSRRLKDLADPTTAQDAVTKAYADNLAIVAGNVPSPGVGDIGFALVADGVDSFGWQSLGGDVPITQLLPTDFSGIVGETQAPVEVFQNGAASYPHLAFDPSVAEGAVVPLVLPPNLDGNALTFTVLCSSPGSGGDARLTMDMTNGTDGVSMSTNDGTRWSAIVTPAAANQWIHVTMPAPGIVIPSGLGYSQATLYLRRDATNVLDTLAADLRVHAIFVSGTVTDFRVS